MKQKAALILVAVLAIALVIWINLLIIRVGWDYITDHLLYGAQDVGLVADEIGWTEAIMLWLTGSAIMMGSSLAGRTRR